MKLKSSIIQITFYLLSLCFLFSCRPQADKKAEDRITIGIVNPSVGDLRGFKRLVNNEVMNIPDLVLLTICFNNAERNFNAVEDYIGAGNNDLFHLERIDCDLQRDEIFQDNTLSDEFRKIFQKTDGIFFLGGDDIPPEIYGKKTSLLTNISTPSRHEFEISFLFHLLGGSQNEDYIPLLEENSDYIVIGFCLGMQSMNVASGGTMYQDIPAELYGLEFVEDVLALDSDQQHDNYWQNLVPDDQMISANFHQIKPVKYHSFFSESFWEQNPKPLVYSSHHQAVRNPGLNLEIVATSMDEKVVEIIVNTKYKNVFGVQFHPETSSLYIEDMYKYLWQPSDTLGTSYYDFLKENESLSFHLTFWEKVGKLFISSKN
jgi:putative glutamine amidotransferase